VLRLSRELDYVPEDLAHLQAMLSDTYFCNFSVFQSLPDNWAIKHLFPIMPIHRLDEPPTRHATIGDISCDSDGKVDRFIDRLDVKRALPLPPFDGRPLYLGAFLVGAYQEIMGDLHNLFGDTHAVHVSLDEQGGVILDTVVKGDAVHEVLEYVQFSADHLLSAFRRDVEAALRNGRIGYQESGRLLRFYEEGLYGYTYLEEDRQQ
ncbi:MAG: arginine decarboxylase, partial [Acidobacteriota bacterium]